MNHSPDALYEQAAAAAFSRQAWEFDSLYGNDTIVRYKRRRVRSHLEKHLASASRILELNCGTGEDAVWLAQQGHKVHATDISGSMLEQVNDKLKHLQLLRSVSLEQCSFTELELLQDKGPYDHIFSNFAGLNATGRLEKVLSAFNFLLKPGGKATLVLLPKFCLWEFSLLLKGKFKTAFRRFSGKKGARAHINGEFFRCWYYNPAYIQTHLSDVFSVIDLEGLCSLVPPSYIAGFAEKHPSLYRFLEKKENSLKSKWPWRSIGDYYIITLQKK
jgi:ubiquinone/menaquinone biosynthesis C-methylase UbiE